MTSPSAPSRSTRAGSATRPSAGNAGAVAAFLQQGEGRKIIAGGMPVILKVSPDMSRGHLMLHEQDVPPGMLVPAHLHQRADQFSLVTEGTLCVLVGDEVYTLQAGAFVWRPAGTRHAVWNPDRTRLARQIEGSLPGNEMLRFFEEFEALTLSGRLAPDELARIAAPYGTFYDEAMTGQIEQDHHVSASGGWRP